MAAPGKPRQIRIQYVKPVNPAHQPIHDELKRIRALERVQALLAPIRLPRPLLLKLDGCDGDANAWYDEGEIVVCYEYVAEILKIAPEKVPPIGITKLDTVAGPLIDTVLHEAAHAVFDLLKIPVFGREEDAADLLSAYIMLKLGKSEARRLIIGTAYQYRTDIQNPIGDDGGQVLLRRARPAGAALLQRFMHRLWRRQKIVFRCGRARIPSKGPR